MRLVVVAILLCIHSISGFVPHNRYNYIGCYKDSPTRNLEHQLSDVDTVDECITQCAQRGYLYAGLQYGSQCFCGNSYRNPIRSDGCTMSCNRGEDTCGGTWANSVYRTRSRGGGIGVGGGTGFGQIGFGEVGFGQVGFGQSGYHDQNYYIGCYKDNPTRNLEQQVNDVSSIHECVKQCRYRNYRYAGIQYGTECFCGNSYRNPIKSMECTMSCNYGGGNCGGVWANSVYATGIYNGGGGGGGGYPIGGTYVGCFKDSQDRRMRHRAKDVDTIDQCISECRLSNYRYAGLQYGSQCFCDNGYRMPERVTNCNMNCNRGTSICGGEWANSVYTTGNRYPFGPFNQDPFGPFNQDPFGPFNQDPFGPFNQDPFGPFNQDPFGRPFPNSVSNKDFVGCYKKLTPSFPPKFQPTFEACIKFCRANSFKFAGFTTRSMCCCGKSFKEQFNGRKCIHYSVYKT